MADDSIKKLSDIHENLAPPGYSFQQRDDHVIFFKLVDNEMLLPEVAECINIDKELHAKLFFKGSLVPLPQCFRHGRDCRLTHKSMLEIFLLTYYRKLKSSIAYLKNFANTNSRKDRCILLVLSDSRYYYDTRLYSRTGFCRKIPLYRQYGY